MTQELRLNQGNYFHGDTVPAKILVPAVSSFLSVPAPPSGLLSSHILKLCFASSVHLQFLAFCPVGPRGVT